MSAVPKADVAARLARVLPAGAVLVDREELKPYECDGLSAYRADAAGGGAARRRSRGRRRAARGARDGRRRWWRAARARGFRAARCRWPTASCCRWRSSTDRGGRLRSRARRACSRASRNLRISAARRAPAASTTRRIPRARSPARSAATSRRIPAACIASSTASRCTTCCKVRAMTIEGDVLDLGSEALDAPGYDLLALVTGSEGLLGDHARGHGEAAAQAGGRAGGDGLVSPTWRAAGEAVANVIGAGIVPAGLEMMDKLATARRRGVRARGLRPRGRGDPAVRIRRHARGGGRRDRAHDRGDEGERRHRHARARRERRRAPALLVGAQGRVPRRGPHLARLLLHRRLHPAARARPRAEAHRGAVSAQVRRCAAPTSSTRATATSIR